MKLRDCAPLLGLVLLAGCSEFLGREELTVAIEGPSAITHTGQTLTFAVTAVGGSLRNVVLVASGLVNRADTVWVPEGVQQVVRSYSVPDPLRAGEFTLAVTAYARDGTRGQARVTLSARDETPPTVRIAAVTPDTLVQPGDTVRVRVQAEDAFALTRVVLTSSGAIARGDTVAVTGTRADQWFTLVVPANTPVGGTLHLAAAAVDGAGLSGSGTPARVHVRDLVDPTVRGALTGGGEIFYPAGSTLRFTVTGTDDRELGWVGYTLSGSAVTADSAAVSGLEASHTFSVPVPAGWAGASAMTVFVRDRSGRRVTLAMEAILVAATSRPSELRSYTVSGGNRRAVLDEKRNRVLLAQPTLSRIAVFSLATRTMGAPIALPGTPRELALGPGGDTLVVSLEEEGSFALVDLSAASPTVSVHVLAAEGDAVDLVQVTARGVALLTTTMPPWGSTYLHERNLTTHATRQRPEGASDATAIARSYDGQYLFFGGLQLRLFDVRSDAFVANRDTYEIPDTEPSSPVSADGYGSRYLFGNQLLDARLATLREMSGVGSSVLAPGGYAAFAWGSLVITRLSDGAAVRTMPLPFAAHQVMVSRDGGTVVALGYAHIAVLTLF